MSLDPRHRSGQGYAPDVVKKLQEVFRKDGGPRAREEDGGCGLSLRIMVGEEYARYYRDLHAKAAKYTEVRSRPH